MMCHFNLNLLYVVISRTVIKFQPFVKKVLMITVRKIDLFIFLIWVLNPIRIFGLYRYPRVQLILQK